MQYMLVNIIFACTKKDVLITSMLFAMFIFWYLLQKSYPGPIVGQISLVLGLKIFPNKPL